MKRLRHITLFLVFLVCIINAQEELNEKTLEWISTMREDKEPAKKKFNFAAFDVGAKVMAYNPEAKVQDKDKYLLNPRTASKKWVTIELSEEIVMESIVLANYEFYSCSVSNFLVLGSTQYPCKKPNCYWEVLGSFRAHNTKTTQTFMLKTPSIVRYIKLLFLSHYGDEHFCTLSLVRVHGSTLLDDLKEAVRDDIVVPPHLIETIVEKPNVTEVETQTTEDMEASLIQDVEEIAKDNDTAPIDATLMNQLMTKSFEIVIEDSELEETTDIETSPITPEIVKNTTQTVENSTLENVTLQQARKNLIMEEALFHVKRLVVSNETDMCFPGDFNYNISVVPVNVTHAEEQKVDQWMHNNVVEDSNFVGPIEPAPQDAKKRKETPTLKEQLVLPQEPVHTKTRENVLKSMLLKIKRQELQHQAVLATLESMQTRYVKAFGDIQNVLRKHADEHNTLARAVATFGRDRSVILKELRQVQQDLEQFKLDTNENTKTFSHLFNSTVSQLTERTERLIQMNRTENFTYMIIFGVIMIVLQVFTSQLATIYGEVTKPEISQVQKRYIQIRKKYKDDDDDYASAYHSEEEAMPPKITVARRENHHHKSSGSLFAHLQTYFARIADTTSPIVRRYSQDEELDKAALDIEAMYQGDPEESEGEFRNLRRARSLSQITVTNTSPTEKQHANKKKRQSGAYAATKRGKKKKSK